MYSSSIAANNAAVEQEVIELLQSSVMALWPMRQRRCRVSRRAVDVSPGIANMGSDDGATQKATQGFKTLEAHKTRWSRNQRELKTAAYLG